MGVLGVQSRLEGRGKGIISLFIAHSLGKKINVIVTHQKTLVRGFCGLYKK